MIQIAVVLLTALALVVAGFLHFTPNYSRVVESDATRIGYEYANLRSLEEAQLMARADRLPAAGDTVSLTDPGIFYEDDRIEEKILGDLSYNSATREITITLIKDREVSGGGE